MLNFIIFCLTLVKFNKEQIGAIVTFFVDSLKQFAFQQGKIENMIVIVDIADQDLSTIPLEVIKHHI